MYLFNFYLVYRILAFLWADAGLAMAQLSKRIWVHGNQIYRWYYAANLYDKVLETH